MSNERQDQDSNRATRMVILAILGLVVVYVGRALFFEGGDTGLGWDDVLYGLGGLALAAVVEFGFFRNR